MQFVPFEEGIEVNGQTVWAIVAGFKSFAVLASTSRTVRRAKTAVSAPPAGISASVATPWKPTDSQ